MSNLKAAKDHVIVKVKMDEKDSYTFESGMKIALQRDTENFDKKYTTISQGLVIHSEYIPAGATIYFHHNATHEMYELFNYRPVSGNEIASNIKYFSIPENQCFLWREGNGQPQPLKGFVTALRVFKPYKGILQGIEPTLLKNTLYVTSGELLGKVVRTLKACDYEVIFNNLQGREERIIRCRHFEDDEHNDREEIIAIDNGATKKVEKGELYLGLSTSDAKPLNSSTHATA
jgi:hypothetical protein